jgi:FtsP/CotA-like multicopper oxidase with cupredoxin domain
VPFSFVRGSNHLALLLCGALLQGALVRADAEPAYDPRSTAAAPCGVGSPPPGHAPPEIRAGADALTLTVRQDGHRLCYVAQGSSDAPVIRVRQGQLLSITLKNEITDPGAIDAVSGPGKLTTPNEAVPETPGFFRVVPGMRHAATGATNLHVHGLAVPPVRPQDDVLSVCTDPAVGPQRCGRRAFTYHYRIPANMPEGLYWYHPHVHGEVQAQMLMGLAGALVVEGPVADAREAAGIPERVLIVRQTEDQDAGKNAHATMTAAPPATTQNPAPRRPAPPPTAIDTQHELLCAASSGIDQISLNGTPVPLGDVPDSALAHLTVPAGGVELVRLLNAATDAFLDVVLIDGSGHLQPLEIVARDGSPVTDDAGAPLASVPTVEPQFIPPSGRLEFLVRAPTSGMHAYLTARSVDTGCAGDRVPERRLALIDAAPGGAAVATAGTAPAGRPDFFSGLLARHTERQRIIALAEYPRPGSEDQIDFYIFERKPGAVLRPYMMGDRPALTVRAGTTEEWIIENWTNELHAFHIHQVHFRVLEIDGQPLEHPPLLDVVNVPYATATGYHSTEGPVRPGRVRIKVSFPAALAGDIPFHCHLVDHEDNGMMAVLRVLPARSPAPAGR